MIARIVYDEVHQVLTSSTYRGAFFRFHTLSTFPTQKIGLTASLPIRLEAELKMVLGLPPTTLVIRAPTAQPQISYHRYVMDRMNTEPVQIAIAVAKVMEIHMDADQIGIIFATSKKEVEAISDAFTHCFSHSDLTSSDKLHNENTWRQGHSRWIAATTGLIHGIDAPNVGCTLFIDLPYGLVNLYQGSGRGGRDGRFCYSIVIAFTPSHYILPIDNDLNCIREGDKWVKAIECRRLEFSRTMDGTTTTCHDLPGSHLCNYCDSETAVCNAIEEALKDPIPTAIVVTESAMVIDPPSFTDTTDYDSAFQDLLALGPDLFTALTQHPEVPIPPSTIVKNTPYDPSLHSAQSFPSASTSAPVVSMAIARDVAYYHQTRRTKEEKFKGLSRLAAMMKGNCPICWAYRGTVQTKHDNIFKDCKQVPGFLHFMNGWVDFKRKTHPPGAFIICFKCQLPQGKFLVSSHPDMTRGLRGRPCPFEDIVVLIVWFIRHEVVWWNRARSVFTSLPANPDQNSYAIWIKNTEGVENFHNGLEMLLWFFVTREAELTNVSV